MPKPTNSSSRKAVGSIWKPTPSVATIDVQDDEEVVMVNEDNEVPLIQNEIGTLFQDNSSEEELSDE